jgi:hypothetical protein
MKSFPSRRNSIPVRSSIKAKPLRDRYASLDTASHRYPELAIRGKRQDRQTLRKVDLPGQRSLVHFRTAREMGQLPVRARINFASSEFRIVCLAFEATRIEGSQRDLDSLETTRAASFRRNKGA